MNSPSAQKRVTKHKRRFCRVEGCSRIVKSQGVCQRHGAKPRTCKIAGCVKQSQGNFKGMCKSHARQQSDSKTFSKKSQQQDLQNQQALVTCRPISASSTKGDASQTARTHGYSHPITNRSDLAPPAARRVSQVSPPTISPNRPTASSSFSQPHPVVKMNRRICKVSGCFSVIKSQGVCQRHGAKPVRCKVAGCAKQAQGSFKGMCKTHCQMWESWKQDTSLVSQVISPLMVISDPPSEEDTGSSDGATTTSVSDDGLSPVNVQLDGSNGPRRQECEADIFAPFCWPEEAPSGRPGSIPQTLTSQSSYALQPRSTFALNSEVDLDITKDIDLFMNLDDNPFEPVAFNPAWSAPV